MVSHRWGCQTLYRKGKCLRLLTRLRSCPLWIQGGVRGFYPLEVAAGMDAAAVRRRYAKEVVLWGNVDKRVLTRGKAEIDAEMKRLAPVVAQGGFIPLVDHQVPDDVPLENYLYYLERRRQMSEAPCAG